MKYWFVNLGKYYDAQRNGGFLWAPYEAQNGKIFKHWEALKDVNIGDVIFCNYNGSIVSIAIAKRMAYRSNIPDEFERTWQQEGRKLEVIFRDIEPPLKYLNYKQFIVTNNEKGKTPFRIDGVAKQGYLFPLSEQFANFFFSKIDPNLVKEIHEFLSEIFDNFIEEIKEEQEQFAQINAGNIKAYNKEELLAIDNKKYIYKEKKSEDKRMLLREKTDPKLKATRIEWSNYLCEINPNHITFTNTKGTHQYLECHHIIPMSAQKDFPTIKLDSMFNLIAVCPICHAQVHYALEEERREIFYKMVEARKTELLKHGFTADKIELIFKSYYSN